MVKNDTWHWENGVVDIDPARIEIHYNSLAVFSIIGMETRLGTGTFDC